jgi:hypothetical protein
MYFHSTVFNNTDRLFKGQLFCFVSVLVGGMQNYDVDLPLDGTVVFSRVCTHAV